MTFRVRGALAMKAMRTADTAYFRFMRYEGSDWGLYSVRLDYPNDADFGAVREELIRQYGPGQSWHESITVSTLSFQRRPGNSRRAGAPGKASVPAAFFAPPPKLHAASRQASRAASTAVTFRPCLSGLFRPAVYLNEAAMDAEHPEHILGLPDGYPDILCRAHDAYRRGEQGPGDQQPGRHQQPGCSTPCGCWWRPGC